MLKYLQRRRASLAAQTLKNLSAMWETQVRSPDQEYSPEKEMLIHSVFLSGESHGERLVGYNHGDTLSTEEPKGVDPESRVELHQLQQGICSHSSFGPPPPLWEWNTPSYTAFKGAPRNKTEPETKTRDTWMKCF